MQFSSVSTDCLLLYWYNYQFIDEGIKQQLTSWDLLAGSSNSTFRARKESVLCVAPPAQHFGEYTQKPGMPHSDILWPPIMEESYISCVLILLEHSACRSLVDPLLYHISQTFHSFRVHAIRWTVNLFQRFNHLACVRSYHNDRSTDAQPVHPDLLLN